MQIGLLGPFEVRTGDGTVADVPGARLRGLLIALALEPGRVVGKATLIDWIWGEEPPADASNALQRLASRLRKVLPDGALESQAGGYRLAVDPESVDAVRFERLLVRARQQDASDRVRLLREALGLWRGAPMQDVGLADSEAFDAAVTRLGHLHATATEERYVEEVATGHGTELIPELTEAVAADPLRERLTAALIRALVADGRDSEAMLAYERTREALADTLGADPSPELAALHVALLRGELSRPVDTRKTNVRAELTSFVGREADLDAVRSMITKHRLTTLIGPGGSGKTRLASEAARNLLGELPDGVWLVEFAPLGSDGDVAQTALAALGLRDTLGGTATTADPVEGLVAALREREMLLILDNCEHVIEPVAALAERLLGECRRLRILATSREPLGITGEALWAVEPLPLPDGADPREIAAAPAVRLLRERAAAVRKDFAPDEHMLVMMLRICRALDGMPLAIELAAARLRTMSIDQLANRLDDRFRLLTGGSRTALPRHRTLRAVVDWSWELLSEAERTVLRRLSVFAGGATLDAAERVCSGGPVSRDDVLDLLTSLAEKSLLIASDDETTRYRMLTTIREYTADRLAEAGETEATRLAHLTCFTELAETAEPHLRRAEQLEWLARLRADHDNLTRALRWVIGTGDAQAAMRLAAATGWYWFLGGRRGEGLELLIAAAELPGEVTDEIRTLAYGMVVLFVTSGLGDEQVGAKWIRKGYGLIPQSSSSHPLLDFATPLMMLLESPRDAPIAFESLRDSSDPWVRAMGRWQAAKMRTMYGEDGPAIEAELTTALAEFRALGERFGIFLALSELAAHLARRGEVSAAIAQYEEAAVVLAELGAVEDVIEVRTQLAQLSWLAGDRAGSESAIAAAERLATNVTWPYALATLALAKAGLARLRGDLPEAREQLAVATAQLGDAAEQTTIRLLVHDLSAYLAEDLEQAKAHRVAEWQAASEARAPHLVARMLIGIADLAVRLGEDEQAARLLAAAVAVRGVPDRSDPDAARLEETVRRSLGDARFAEASQEGTQAEWPALVERTLGVSLPPVG
ncbi:BTAD domain-containing putative transcriptional regulator [Microlunatus parietis]|uniref:Putative ATPase/DNA-binding SARP family transcriptional activator/tetratricopeptide (TPR) repeat protein n=1 Tax=Microlunatus parietis TaxID=682979 RepID=A0A7Y9I618_9ACTN|nr:BTAD domain-containing putative transcriptional regulator [Microlunatus parietis]NYE70946.1 putative ATPase/DNA-binding SARP family transcriptional activator/tetratricopeptide (TPR) repeat protein [Microlunatus parietis]